MIKNARTLVVDAGLDQPVRSAQKPIASLVQDSLQRRGVVAAKSPVTTAWDSLHFQLDGVSIFRDSTAQQKAAILAACSQSTLEEAFFIEKAGLAYDAKLTLLADNTEERMMYSLFAADEAAHLATVMAFLPHLPQGKGGPFLQLLADVIETADAHTLAFVVQVVLEGWGITHYRALAKDCRDESLKIALERIALDETRHHGSGLVLFNARQSNVLQQAEMVDILVRFLAMVQCGPQAVARAVDAAHGGLTTEQRVNLMEELHAEQHAAERLDVLRGLMKGAQALPLVEALEARGGFTAWNAAKCAAAMG